MLPLRYLNTFSFNLSRGSRLSSYFHLPHLTHLTFWLFSGFELALRHSISSSSPSPCSIAVALHVPRPPNFGSSRFFPVLRIPRRTLMATFPPSSATLTWRTSGGIPQNQPNDLPTFIVERNILFQTLKEKHDKVIAAKARASITVRLVTGAGDSSSELQATAWETTPGHLLKHVAKAIAAEAVVARVDGVLWDLSRPLEKDCKVSHLSYNDPDGRAVLWHSAAHVLGEAIENHYGCLLSHGPPTTTGFFTMWHLTPTVPLKRLTGLLSKQKLRNTWKRSRNLIELWSAKTINAIYLHTRSTSCIMSRDSCRMTALPPFIAMVPWSISALALIIKTPNRSRPSRSRPTVRHIFLNDPTGDSLQRISGVAFATAEQMKQWELFVAEAKARDHQVVGKCQKLFWFSPLSPGSAFLLPHGTRIFNAIQMMLRE